MFIQAWVKPARGLNDVDLINFRHTEVMAQNEAAAYVLGQRWFSGHPAMGDWDNNYVVEVTTPSEKVRPILTMER
jgi:hypothetical protein